MHAPRKHLKIAIETHLLPVLSRAGFNGPNSLKGQGLFYAYQRRDGDTYRFVTIQFEKRGGPKFRLNFSEATAASIEQAHGFPSTSEVLCEPFGELRGTLHPSRAPYFKSFTWFRSSGLLPRVTGMNAEAVAKRAAKLYPEIENWWEKRVIGPHLWISELLFSGRKRRQLKTRSPS